MNLACVRKKGRWELSRLAQYSVALKSGATTGTTMVELMKQ
jgi:hypothetical protein